MTGQRYRNGALLRPRSVSLALGYIVERRVARMRKAIWQTAEADAARLRDIFGTGAAASPTD